MADKVIELLRLMEKFGVKPGKIIGAGDKKVTPIKKPILTKQLNRDYIDQDVKDGKIGTNTVKNEIEDVASLFFQKKLNDVEVNNLLNNLTYLDNALNPTNVVDLATKKPIVGEGLETLKEAEGLIAPPTTTVGRIQSKLNEAKRGLQDISGEPDLADLIKGAGKEQLSYNKMHNEGLVRAVARSILYEDIKAGKIKGMTLEQLGSAKDPIQDFRKIYGESALEQLDSLTPEFNQMYTPQEGATLARKKFTLTPDETRLPGSQTYEELEKIKKGEVVDMTSEVDKRKTIDDLIDEYNANQDRLSLTDEEGGTAIGYDEFRKLQDRNKQIADALENKGISSKIEEEVKPEGIVIPFKKKITEPEEFADGGITRTKFASGGKGKKVLDIINQANKKLKGKKSMETVNPKTGEVTVPDEFIATAEKQTKQFTDDEMIAYIKKYKEEGPTLEEFTKKINEETGSNFTPEQLAHAYRVKVAYPHSTPIVDSQGKFIGGGLYNPPLDVSISDRETLTENIMQTRKSKGLKVPKKYQKEATETAEISETSSKAGEGKFTKQQVLEKIIQKTIEANPTDEYVQKTFPNFIKEIRAKPELANNENVWKTFTQDFPENKRLVVYGDDTVDFFTKGENLPEGMRQTQELADTYGISMQEASRIKQMEPEDQVMEIKKLEVLKSRPQKGMSLEDEMNMVLNQYDKSMFIKNDQGIVDVTNPENIQKMAILLKKDHPELYKKLEEGSQTNVLEEFDITGRKPNANGGLNYLMGF